MRADPRVEPSYVVVRMTLTPHLSLILFTRDPTLARKAERAGVDLFIVDWETKNKAERQRFYDTEINNETPNDVAIISSAATSPVIVRINPCCSTTVEEVQRALDQGAQGLMLPMARSIRDVEVFLKIVGDRARTIVQIETQALVEVVSELRLLSWDAVYIGLHDLMISRDSYSLWEAVADGTVDRICEALEGRKIGFAGATVIGGGYPLPFTMILHELARLGATLTFLRRTFRREILDRSLVAEVAALRATWAACIARGPEAIAADRDAMLARLKQLHGSYQGFVLRHGPRPSEKER
jgi:HpcH/HpaI aldolase/citrate lyase family